MWKITYDLLKSTFKTRPYGYNKCVEVRQNIHLEKYIINIICNIFIINIT